VDLSGRIQAAIASVDLKRAAVLPPQSLVEHAADLYLLGPAGGNLLQMASALNANARQVSELRGIGLVERELWRGIAANLGRYQSLSSASRLSPCSPGVSSWHSLRIVPVETLAQSTAMGANTPITAAVFSAFLKCTTKAHLISIGEPAPNAHFADIEARISSMYKAVAKRRSPIGAEVAELLDFREPWRNVDHDAITHYVDCDTAVYDLAPPPHRTGGRHRKELSPPRNFVPIRF
jgi:hypothetical protein